MCMYIFMFIYIHITCIEVVSERGRVRREERGVIPCKLTPCLCGEIQSHPFFKPDVTLYGD